MTDWQQPLLSVDVVAVKWDGEALQFALHDRPNEPFAGRSALPGVLLLPGEALVDAVHRAVAVKIGAAEASIIQVTQVGAFDGTNRDPRGATISIAHLAVIEHDASKLESGQWAADATGLPFDHDAIVGSAIDELGLRLWSDWPLTRAILGEEFTTKSALALSHRLDALPNRASNVARWLEATGRVERIGQTGRATVWSWLPEESAD